MPAINNNAVRGIGLVLSSPGARAVLNDERAGAYLQWVADRLDKAQTELERAAKRVGEAEHRAHVFRLELERRGVEDPDEELL